MLLWGRATLANHCTFWHQYWLTWLLRCLSWNWDLTPPRHFSYGVGDGPEEPLAFLNLLNIVASPLLPGLKALPVWRVSLVLWPRLDLVAFDSFFFIFWMKKDKTECDSGMNCINSSNRLKERRWQRRRADDEAAKKRKSQATHGVWKS